MSYAYFGEFNSDNGMGSTSLSKLLAGFLYMVVSDASGGVLLEAAVCQALGVHTFRKILK